MACSSNHIDAERVGNPVTDYKCPACDTIYQLKSTKRSFGITVTNSAYEKKMAAISTGNAPHYVFLQYSPITWQVRDLFVIPGHFFTPAVIQRRNPLSSTAKRSGWVGSNILLGQLPHDARIQIVSSGVVRDIREVREDWGRFRFLQTDKRSSGGWGAAVLRSVRIMQRESKSNEFTLQGFYERFVSDLSVQYPNNQNVEAKVRQQLQVLRGGGILDFLKPGHFRIVG